MLKCMNLNNDEQEKGHQFLRYKLSKYESCETWSEGEEELLKIKAFYF